LDCVRAGDRRGDRSRGHTALDHVGPALGAEARAAQPSQAALHRRVVIRALSCAASITGSTTIGFMPDVRAIAAAIGLSVVGCSLMAGMPVAQAPPIEPSPLPICFPA